MLIRSVLVATTLLLPPSGVLADDVLPGLWEITLEAHVDALPDFAPGPATVTQCLTKADASDPTKLLASVAAPGSGDCAYTERSYTGSHFRFKMQCSGSLQLRSSGDVTLSSSKIDGDLTTSSTIEGMPVEFRSAIHGHRVGDC